VITNPPNSIYRSGRGERKDRGGGEGASVIQGSPEIDGVPSLAVDRLQNG